VSLRAALVVAVVAAAARVAILPFATADGGDATARTWMAWDWMQDPRPITHGVWGPLHTYLIAFAMALNPDPVTAPVVLGIVLSVAAAVALYAFTAIEFESGRAAWIVALTYAVYPIAIRNGVSVRSETPFALLLLLSMIAVARARQNPGSWRAAAAGGLALTAAAMLRYEGWILIPLLAALLWGKPKLLAVFVVCAAVHPVLWMIGNGLHYGDPLYSMKWASRWELVAMGRGALPRSRLVESALWYPFTLARGMTLPFAFASLAGAALALGTRHRARVWLLPLAGITLLWVTAIARGSLVPKLNYTETAGVLLFPFAALAYRRAGVGRWTPAGVGAAAVALVGSGIVFSCAPCLARVGLAKLAGISPIPRIRNQEIALQLPPILLESMGEGHRALISDHYGWGTTQHVALLTRLRRSEIFLAPGAPNRQLDRDSLLAFVKRRPRGALVTLSGSRFSMALGIYSGAARSATLGGTSLRLEPVRSLPWPAGAPAQLSVFRYTAAPALRDSLPTHPT